MAAQAALSMPAVWSRAELAGGALLSPLCRAVGGDRLYPSAFALMEEAKDRQLAQMLNARRGAPLRYDEVELIFFGVRDAAAEGDFDRLQDILCRRWGVRNMLAMDGVPGLLEALLHFWPPGASRDDVVTVHAALADPVIHGRGVRDVIFTRTPATAPAAPPSDTGSADAAQHINRFFLHRALCMAARDEEARLVGASLVLQALPNEARAVRTLMKMFVSALAARRVGLAQHILNEVARRRPGDEVLSFPHSSVFLTPQMLSDLDAALAGVSISARRKWRPGDSITALAIRSGDDSVFQSVCVDGGPHRAPSSWRSAAVPVALSHGSIHAHAVCWSRAMHFVRSDAGLEGTLRAEFFAAGISSGRAHTHTTVIQWLERCRASPFFDLCEIVALLCTHSPSPLFATTAEAAIERHLQEADWTMTAWWRCVQDAFELARTHVLALFPLGVRKRACPRAQLSKGRDGVFVTATELIIECAAELAARGDFEGMYSAIDVFGAKNILSRAQNARTLAGAAARGGHILILSWLFLWVSDAAGAPPSSRLVEWSLKQAISSARVEVLAWAHRTGLFSGHDGESTRLRRSLMDHAIRRGCTASLRWMRSERAHRGVKFPWPPKALETASNSGMSAVLRCFRRDLTAEPKMHCDS